MGGVDECQILGGSGSKGFCSRREGASHSGEEKVDYDGDDVLLVVIKIVAMRGLKRR